MDYELVSDKDWEEMVLKSDNAYFFSSPAWAKVIEETYGEYRAATRLYHVNGKSILVPMMEKNTKYGFKSFSSMPFGYGGFFSESEVTTDDFIRIVEDIIGGKHTFYMPLQPFENISLGKSVVDDEWKVKDEWNYMHILDIKERNFEDLWNNYDKNTRNRIRKATKSGVKIEYGTSLDDFKDFYTIWSQASQTWGSESLVHPFEFFQNLYKYGSSHVKLTLATIDDQIIAGNVSFLYSKTIYLYFSAFVPEYGKFNPTRLIDNDEIKQACQGDYKYINFGPSLKLASMTKYKEGFGAQDVEIEIYLVSSKGARMMGKINNVGKSLKNKFIR